MSKTAIAVITISILASTICLPSSLAHGDTYEERRQKRSLAIKTALLDSAEKLLLQEIRIIRTIDDARYMYLETELPALFPVLMVDVVYLLDWALRIDPNDIKANFLLGKIYYLRHDLGEGFADRKAVELAKKHLSKAIELSSQAQAKIKNSEILEAKKMFKQLKEIPEGAFWDEPKEKE